MITITLNEILAANPCVDGFLYALHRIDKITDDEYAEYSHYKYVHDLPCDILSLADDTEHPAAFFVTDESFEYAIWALRTKPGYGNLWRKFAVWCGRQIEHLMTDERSINALNVAWRHSDGLATDNELDAAWAAAWAAAGDAQQKKLIEILNAGEWV